MSRRTYDEAYYQARLYELLPELYRSRDAGGTLARFLELFGTELFRLRGNMNQLWRDFYVDTSQDWVVPYIADLVGTNLLHNDAARNRNEVRRTIRWRRRKGTLDALAEVAAETADWGAHAVEMFERLVWAQHLNHQRPDAVQTIDLADAPCLSRLNTAFDTSCRTIDLRPPKGQLGRHRIRKVSLFLFGLGAHRVEGGEPGRVDAHRWTFSALRGHVPLYAGGDRGDACRASNADTCGLSVDAVPIRGRDFAEHAGTYFDQPLGFTIHEDGIPLCTTSSSIPETASVKASVEFAELARRRGIILADPAQFSPAQRFRIEAVRWGARLISPLDPSDPPSPVVPSPGLPFDQNFQIHGAQGSLTTTGSAYVKGHGYVAGPPDHHRPELLLRITPEPGSSLTFPECEIIVRSSRGRSLMVFLAGRTFLAEAPHHVWVAEDGATYSGLGDAALEGDPDRNPDRSAFGAFLVRHRLRKARGQVRRIGGTVRRAVYRNLCCWDQPLQRPPAPGEVAIDPERGRFVFPPGEVPSGELSVDYRFGRAGPVGAGPFSRDEVTATTTVGRHADADHTTIQAAIDAAPDGSNVVIEVVDSGTYPESVVVAGRSFSGLTIRARPLTVPSWISSGTALDVRATSAVGQVTVEGFVLVGGIALDGASDAATIRSCSQAPSAGVRSATSKLLLEASSIGPVETAGDVSATDSILHHPEARPGRTAGKLALLAPNAATLDSTTVLGEMDVGVLSASNSLLLGDYAVVNQMHSCIRFSRHEATSSGVPTYRSTRMVPIFVSLDFGSPGYGMLHPSTAREVRAGAERGREMGAFFAADIPLKEQNVRIKMAEYAPAGIEVVPVRVIPGRRFTGVIR